MPSFLFAASPESSTSVESEDCLQLQTRVLGQLIKLINGGLDPAPVFLGRHRFPTMRVGEGGYASGQFLQFFRWLSFPESSRC